MTGNFECKFLHDDNRCKTSLYHDSSLNLILCAKEPREFRFIVVAWHEMRKKSITNRETGTNLHYKDLQNGKLAIESRFSFVEKFAE